MIFFLGGNFCRVWPGDAHTNVCRTVSYCFVMLRQFRSIRHLVCASVLQSLVTALVLCRLDYGNSTLAGWSSGLLSTTPPVGPERSRSSNIKTSSLWPHHRCTSQFTLVTCAGAYYLQGCRSDIPCSDRRLTTVKICSNSSVSLTSLLATDSGPLLATTWSSRLFDWPTLALARFRWPEPASETRYHCMSPLPHRWLHLT